MSVKMRIPSKFPQFEKETVLILVTGFQTADLYLAADGEMNKIKSLRVPRRRYSDKEGFFRGTVSSGSAREYPKQAVLEEFLKLLEAELKTISKKEKISSIFLFSPDYAMNEIKSVFPSALKNKIKFSIKGNYSHYSQLELLEKVDRKRKKL